MIQLHILPPNTPTLIDAYIQATRTDIFQYGYERSLPIAVINRRIREIATQLAKQAAADVDQIEDEIREELE